MHSIGLTGGIASGKSTVSQRLAQKDAVIVDADQLGHQTYEPCTDTYDQVVSAFGRDVVAEDGSIDRLVLGGKVFGDPEQMTRLTDIVWPGILRLAEAEFKRLAAAGTKFVVLEAAVMIEAEWTDVVDEVWVVTAPPLVARERLMNRNGFSAEEADTRIQSQISNADRLEHADVVLDTDCSLEAVHNRVDRAWAAMRARVLETAG